MTKKAEERASYFRPSKKQRVSEKQEVIINIGMMELNKDEVAYILRGKTLPLKISKEADYKTLLESALKKRSDYDKTFDSDRPYKLVYQDGQSAQIIPGTDGTFTLFKYKQGLGKSYGIITLYLCPFFPLSDEEQATGQTKTTADFSSSESDREQVKGEKDDEGKAPEDGTSNNTTSSTTATSSSNVPGQVIEIFDDPSSQYMYTTTDFVPVGISENESVEEAIRQSIEVITEEGQSELSEAELMLRLRLVIVSRLNLWKTALPYFKRNGFLSNLGLLSVTFATFTEEEDAVDLGGPRREFFHLLLRAICKDSGTLTRTSKGWVVRCNIRSLQNRDYISIGQMLATVIVQGGEPPCLFSQAICNYICNGFDQSHPDIEEIPDAVIKNDLHKISKSKNKEELNAILNECDWRYNIDGLPTSVNFHEKEQFVKEVAKYLIIIKCQPMLDQLIEGLKYYEVCDMVRGCKEIANYLFLKKENTKCTSRHEHEILRPIFSPAGSNRRIQEEIVMTKFIEFLNLCEGKGLLELLEDDGIELTAEEKEFIPQISPTHVLLFATGACSIPAIGFDPSPSCCFVHDESKTIPCAQTCSNMLYLYVNNRTVDGGCLNYIVTALMNGGIFSKL